jgi:hypothetical protein
MWLQWKLLGLLHSGPSLEGLLVDSGLKWPGQGGGEEGKERKRGWRDRLAEIQALGLTHTP